MNFFLPYEHTVKCMRHHMNYLYNNFKKKIHVSLWIKFSFFMLFGSRALNFLVSPGGWIDKTMAIGAVGILELTKKGLVLVFTFIFRRFTELHLRTKLILPTIVPRGLGLDPKHASNFSFHLTLYSNDDLFYTLFLIK